MRLFTCKVRENLAMALPARFRQLLIRKGVRLSHVRASQVRRQRQKKKCATTVSVSILLLKFEEWRLTFREARQVANRIEDTL